MNRESFSDDEVAEALNNSFVSIKVDREERPDLDKVYMIFSEAMNGNGGWPLNVIATPEGKPIFVGTYFPKMGNRRMMGLIDLLNRVNEVWTNDRQKLIDEGDRIAREVKKISENYSSGNIKEDAYKKAADDLKRLYDKEHGGFGTKPKFPMPQYILYMLKYGELNDDKEAVEIAEDTLIKMYKGGIFDHIGYGFFRYSVDEKWLVPHFEKMLYDNALMGIAYTKAYEITNKPIYKEVAEKIYEFVIRDMLSENGGFYSALDADSEGEEGKYYLFDYDEITTLLGEEWGLTYNKYYNITAEGNFEGKNIPNLIDVDIDSISPKDSGLLNSINQMLITYRENRPMPHRDEKILTSWNGLLIGSLSHAGRVFDNPFYIKKAREAAEFILAHSVDDEEILLSTHVSGNSYNYGYLEDYSFFIYGLINLYEVSEDEKYLDIAIKLTDDMLELFKDEDDSGLYFYGNKSDDLILRPKDFYDGAIPSGNGMALTIFMKLYVLTKDERYFSISKNHINSYGNSINQNPLAHLYTLLGLKNSSS